MVFVTCEVRSMQAQCYSCPMAAPEKYSLFRKHGTDGVDGKNENGTQ